MADTYNGACFCGAVEVTVSGAPQAMGFCHCTSCRSWSASPVNAFALWRAADVSIAKGGEHIGSFAKTEQSHRKFCKLCGGHVMTDHPGLGMVDVYAATTPTHPFQPALHVHYGEKVLALHDGLPKFNDVPAEFGGSGDLLAE